MFCSVLITGLTAAIVQPLLKNDDWGWNESILFSSILSATDPVAVVALLKELGRIPVSYTLVMFFFCTLLRGCLQFIHRVCLEHTAVCLSSDF